MFLRRLPAVLWVVILLHFAPQPAQSADKADKARADEIAELRKEITALREENRRLRQLIIESVDDKFIGPVPRAKIALIPEPQDIAEAAAGKSEKSSKSAKYWLSTGGKRHNSKCRYFNGAGRACTKDEGVPCKICGG